MTLGIVLNGPGLGLAFAAGLVSFVSPCVLPLVPGYLSFVSGVGFDELGARTRRVGTTTAAFVLGFTAMFVALGAGAGWFGDGLLTHQRLLEIIAGAFIIAGALVLAGIPLPRVLAREHRLELRSGTTGHVNAGLTGVGFAIAWTPCLGPTLGGILTLAAGGKPTQGAVLLAAYSLGLGVPFLVFGLLFTRALGLVRALRRHWRLVSIASAALLLAFGVLLITGEFTRFTTQLTRFSQFGGI
jgi:cytochrome c-type biogenesis protein